MSGSSQLKTLEGLRGRRLQEAEMALAQARQSVSDLSDQLQRARQEVAVAEENLAARRAAGPLGSGQSFTGNEAQVEQRYLARLSAHRAACATRAASLAQSLAGARATAATLREKLLQARREHEVVSRHRARQEAGARRLAERRAEADGEQ